MIDPASIRKAWEMLDRDERRMAFVVLSVVVLAALSSALMVGSVLPFLSVLADPSRIQSTPVLAWTYDALGFTSSYGYLVALGIGALGVILLSSAIQILRTYVVARFALMQMHKSSHRLLSVYLRQPYEFFLNRHSGDLGTKILSESQEVVGRFFMPATNALAGLCTTMALVGLLLWVQPLVALLSFVLLGGFYAAVFAMSRHRLVRLGRRRAEANAQRFRLATESLGGIKDIKLLGREERYAERFERPSSELAWTEVKMNVLSEMPVYALYALAFGGMIVLCLALLDPESLESGAALGGILPLLGVFAFAGQRLMPELNRVYLGVSNLRYGAAAVDAVHADLVGAAAQAAPKDGSAQPLGFCASVRLEGLSYSYPGASETGLYDLSLEIRSGERIGIVGSSGAGKSTLADVLLGLLMPTGGRIVVDNVPISDRNVRAWQRRVGYVPQDIFLADASIAENIALGLPAEDVDKARLRDAARTARIDRFIEEHLPAGYDTMVGERGVRLSGGQKQRIGIARALYHDADLIIFDEATSALDSLTEQEVMAAIDALPGDKTIIIIAHRLTTVRNCDRILVMSGGRQMAFAPWEELASVSEEFRKLAGEREAA